MKRKLVLGMLGLFLSVTAFSNSGVRSYVGKTEYKLVFLQVSDHIAFIEYCDVDHNNAHDCKFDTLKLCQGKYVGKFSEILTKGNDLIFKPGNITLREGLPDVSLNKIRNLGYLHYAGSRLKSEFEWTGFALNEFDRGEWKSRSLLDPDEFRSEIQLAYDSLSSFYRSNITGEIFTRVEIKNRKLFPEVCLESTDSSEIIKIWRLLATGSPKKIGMFPYLVQFPISILPFAFFDLDVAILSMPFMYPVLIGSERIINNRLHAGSSYKVIFYSRGKKADDCVVKIRNSIILGNQYNYRLPFPFDKKVLLK